MSARRDVAFSLANQSVAVTAGMFRAVAIPLMLAGNLPAFAAWQTYVLYASLVTLLVLGVTDGYLLRFRETRLAGAARSSASAGAMVGFGAVLVEVAVLLFVITSLGGSPVMTAAVLCNIPLMLVAGTCTYHLHLTGRMAQASLVGIAERMAFVVVVSSSWWFFGISLWLLVLMDLGSRLLGATLLLGLARDGLPSSFSPTHGSRELLVLLRRGFPVMLGSYAVTLAVSAVRLVLERVSDDVTFANYSLAFSFISVVLVLGQGLGYVVYPRLASSSSGERQLHYGQLEQLFTFVIPVIFLLYYPLVVGMHAVLPQFVLARSYLGPLMVVMGLQLVVVALVNPYYRILALQAELLRDVLLAAGMLLPVLLAARESVLGMTAAQAIMLVGLLLRARARFARRLDLAPSVAPLLLVVFGAIFVGASMIDDVAVSFAAYAGTVLTYLIVRRKVLEYLLRMYFVR